MITEIKIPQINVNEDLVTLVEWYVRDHATVNVGDLVCCIETTKTVMELEAERPGIIHILAKEGEKIKVGHCIGYIMDSLEEIRQIEAEIFIKTEYEIQATKKALKLAEQLNIDLRQIKINRTIREKDVLTFSQTMKPIDTRPIPVIIERRGKVDPIFLDMISNDKNFAKLSSDLKVHLYRQNGAIIGADVKIGGGSFIISENIDLGDRSEIGENCYIKTESFVLGKMSIIGNSANIVTKVVQIGDMLFSGNNITIGGGGAFGENAGLFVGDNCLISSGCVLNTGERIVIGNEVGLSPFVKLYTHNHWQNILEGYRANFGEIRIEDKAYITGNSIIVPGVIIGEGATVLANSTVVQSVEPYTIVSGNPAKRIGKIKKELSLESKEKIVDRILKRIKHVLKYRGFDSEQVAYTREYDLDQPLPKKVILTFKIKNYIEGRQLDSVIFDLTEYKVLGREDTLSDEVRNFLRRHGIRFRPIYWRYSADKGLYNQ